MMMSPNWTQCWYSTLGPSTEYEYVHVCLPILRLYVIIVTFFFFPSFLPFLSRVHQVAKKVERTLVASWSEKGVVHIWDTSKHAILLDSPSVGGASAKSLTGHKEKPLFSFSGHQVC